MKIMLVSDSHGYLKYFWQAYEKVKPVDLILHMGDMEEDAEQIRELAGCPLDFVPGNNDYMSENPQQKVITLAGKRILMTHGHRQGVYRGIDGLEAAAEKEKADVVLYGHTHLPDITRRGRRIFVNPGSIALPRQNGREPSYGILDIDRKGEFHFTINYVRKTRSFPFW